ncbi:hypothetical protein HMPREF3225_00819 [Staphylococcus lugdunensis]|uniref:Uncharacterized protein n=1 Tax=Staphylococcus lugdunensis TaxID=28035 RepID=A0ABD4EGS8_STALU|nr:hypothetical protein HMPREF3225_00819 [Staphylococcus lugdunensis]
MIAYVVTDILFWIKNKKIIFISINSRFLMVLLIVLAWCLF